MENTTTKPLTAKKQEMILAALRSQILDIHLGTISESEWRRRVDQAIALGVNVPKEWKS